MSRTRSTGSSREGGGGIADDFPVEGLGGGATVLVVDGHGHRVIAGRDEIERAADRFRSALHADETYGPAHNSLGLMYFEDGDLFQAILEFERAMELMPQDPAVYYNLGLTLETAVRRIPRTRLKAVLILGIRQQTTVFRDSRLHPPPAAHACLTCDAEGESHRSG